jgi:hypothetical protein
VTAAETGGTDFLLHQVIGTALVVQVAMPETVVMAAQI